MFFYFLISKTLEIRIDLDRSIIVFSMQSLLIVFYMLSTTSILRSIFCEIAGISNSFEDELSLILFSVCLS